MALKKRKSFKVDKRVILFILIFTTLISVLVFSKKTVISRDNYRIELEKTEETIYIGEVIKLNYTIHHGNSNQIIWSTSNEKIATVDASGNIKGISFGIVTINATLKNANTASLTLKVISHPVYLKLNTDIKPIKNWYNKQLNITIDYQNIDNLKYCVVLKEICEPNIKYKNKITLKNGIWHLYLKGTDKNNKEFSHHEIFKIDLEKPDCNLNHFGKFGNVNSTIELECNDLSGIDRYEWYRDNEKVLVTTDNKINASEIYLSGKHKYSVKVYDNVLNVNTFKIN